MFEVQGEDDMIVLATTFDTSKKLEQVRVIVPMDDADSDPEPTDHLVRLLVKSAAEYYSNRLLH